MRYHYMLLTLSTFIWSYNQSTAWGSDENGPLLGNSSCEDACNDKYDACRKRAANDYNIRIDECCILAGGQLDGHVCTNYRNDGSLSGCLGEAAEKKEKRDKHCEKKALKCLDDCTPLPHGKGL